MKLIKVAGATSDIWQIFIADSSSTTGAGLAGLAFNSASLTAYYHRDTDTTATAITLATMTVGSFTSSGFKEIDATNMPGWYQFCPPNAAIASGAKSCAFHLKGATNMAPLPIECQLTAVNPDSATAFMTSVATVTTVTNQLTAAAIATGVWQDATAGDFTTASSIGKSLYTSGVVPGGTNGLFIAGTNAATTITTGLTTTFSGNLTGSVASVTGAVGSVTGAVGSVTGAVGSVTGAVGSVTGNVGGNVVGTVASVVGAVGSVTGNVGGNVVGTVASVVGAVGSVTAGVTVTTNNDKTGYTLSTTGMNNMSDNFLDRDMSTGTDSGSPTVRTPRQALRALRNKNSAVAGIVYKEDDTTTSWTYTLTTDATADPITVLDPA